MTDEHEFWDEADEAPTVGDFDSWVGSAKAELGDEWCTFGTINRGDTHDHEPERVGERLLEARVAAPEMPLSEVADMIKIFPPRAGA